MPPCGIPPIFCFWSGRKDTEIVPKESLRETHVMASLALGGDFTPLVHHPSLLLKSERTPSPPSHIPSDFGSLRTKLNLDSMQGAYSTTLVQPCPISININAYHPNINLSWTAVAYYVCTKMNEKPASSPKESYTLPRRARSSLYCPISICSSGHSASSAVQTLPYCLLPEALNNFHLLPH